MRSDKFVKEGGKLHCWKYILYIALCTYMGMFFYTQVLDLLRRDTHLQTNPEGRP